MIKSFLEITEQALIGNNGDASLMISDKSTLKAKDIILSNLNTSDSTLTLSGKDSVLNASNIILSKSGDATLIMNNGLIISDSLKMSEKIEVNLALI